MPKFLLGNFELLSKLTEIKLNQQKCKKVKSSVFLDEKSVFENFIECLFVT